MGKYDLVGPTETGYHSFNSVTKTKHHENIFVVVGASFACAE